MKRVALYSSSKRPRAAPDADPETRPARPPGNRPFPEPPSGAARTPLPPVFARLRRIARFGWAAAALSALLAAWVLMPPAKAPRPVTPRDIDRAVLHALETRPLPSPAARAYAAVIPSVVRVRGLDTDPDGDDEIECSTGTGVVVVDKGLILTNLHVVSGGRLVKVVFADGLESEAAVVALRPENDLAVLQSKTVPDDLAPASLGSSRRLAPGDHVAAVGFPFGIGPSVSAGVVSGIDREYRSPEGRRLLTRLIQFDAAANPGNSGGPLVNVDPALIRCAVRLAAATRDPARFGLPNLAGYLSYGASPRAPIHLIEGARALAFLRGRSYTLPEDVVDLVPDVFRHRLVLSYQALADGMTADQILHAVVQHIPAPEKPLEAHVRTGARP